METRKSIWSEMTFLRIIFFWLIVPIIIAAIVAKNYKVFISSKTIKVSSGVFNKMNNEYAVAGITQINIYQSFFGRIFNYGDVNISVAGNRLVCLSGICNPSEVKKTIETKLSETANSMHMLIN